MRLYNHDGNEVDKLSFKILKMQDEYIFGEYFLQIIKNNKEEIEKIRLVDPIIARKGLYKHGK